MLNLIISKALKEIDSYNDKKENLPDNLTDFFTVEEEAKYREYFFGDSSDEAKHERKVSRNEHVLNFKRSFYGRSLYWLDAKSRNLRRGAILVYYAIVDLVSGTRIQTDFEKDEIFFLERIGVLDDWTSPFRQIIKNRVDEIVAEQKLAKDEL